MSEFDDHQRRRFMRPDAHRYLRHDAHRYIRHDAYRFMKPGSPIYVGKDVVKYCEPEFVERLSAREAERKFREEFDAEVRELLKIKEELAEIKRLLWYRRLLLDGKYDPNQPRVPAGHPDGGQWTSGGGAPGGEADRNEEADRSEPEPAREGDSSSDHQVIHDRSGEEPWKSVASQYRSDGSLARQTILNRDGSVIFSEFSADPDADGWDERHRVQLADGSVVTFQNSGETQTAFDGEGQRIFSTDGTGEPQATTQLVQARVATTRPTLLGAATVLYGWLSGQNAREQTAVFRFRAEAFRPGAAATDSAVRIERLSKEQVQEICGEKYAEVQSLLNESVRVLNRGDYRSAAEYGTAVHKRIAREINGPDTTPRSPPRDPNFRAEVSFIKSEVEGYGKPGTVRVDVLANIGNQTVCVIDPKTGRRGLSLPRMFEIATNVGTFFPGTERIIVTEARPDQ